MRHRKDTFKIGRDLAHRRCLIANMVKSLIEHGRIETTVRKAKELRRHADRIVTLGKRGDLHAIRLATAALMVRYNALTPKQRRQAKEGDTSMYNTDRKVIHKLFKELGPRFATRQGGYTRIVRLDRRQGDNAPTCIIEYLPA